LRQRAADVLAHPSLYSAADKLFRAREHIRNLRRRMDRFIESRPYEVRLNPDSYPDTYGRQRGAAIEVFVVKPIPAVRWGTVIGDVIHNLRSALDHIAWGLTDVARGPAPDPIPDGSPWHRVAFPIFIDKSKYFAKDRKGRPERTSGHGMLWGVDPKLLPRFDALQPFNTGQGGDPRLEPLSALNELWNRDKHRRTALVGAFVGVKDLRSVPPIDELPRLGPEVLDLGPPGPFEDGTVLGRIRPSPQMGRMNWSLLEYYLNMNLVFTFDVAFEEGPPGNGEVVLDLLRRLANATRVAILCFVEELLLLRERSESSHSDSNTISPEDS
jgi:hypothetical protein